MAFITNDDLIAYVLITSEKDQEENIAIEASNITIEESSNIVASVYWSATIPSGQHQLIVGIRATSEQLLLQLISLIEAIEGVQSTTVQNITAYYKDGDKKRTPIDKP